MAGVREIGRRGFRQRRRAEPRAAMRPLGRRVFAERPKALAARYGGYWRSWRSEAEHDRPAAAA